MHTSEQNSLLENIYVGSILSQINTQTIDSLISTHWKTYYIYITKNSISYEIRATKTSAYQAVKLGPLSWDNVKQH